MKPNAVRVGAALLLLSVLHRSPAETRYVNVNSTTPAPPYTDWSTAATNIQDAVDAAQVGETVLVMDGLYRTGGRAIHGLMTNRVALDKAVTLASVNGPEVTIIQGYQVPGSTNGDGAIRCLYMTNGALITGFTLTNGATMASGDQVREQTGGGIWCELYAGQATNCILAGNSAFRLAGGVSGGTLLNCRLVGNSARTGGGASGTVMSNCALNCNWAQEGGGMYGATLRRCTLAGNSAQTGGAASEGVLENCLVMNNSATNGGGAAWCDLFNCTLAGNSAVGAGGGAYGCSAYNCIVVSNTAPGEPNYSGGALQYTCTTPMPPNGVGNIASDPLFVDQINGNLRLQSNSPCINAGTNTYARGTADLDDNPRIIGGTVDMGACEHRPKLVLMVWQDSATPTPPYDVWTSAAHTIQDAVDAAVPGDEVLVTNGVYSTGGRAVSGVMTNRVAVDRALAIRSVNGPDVTVIQGYQLPGTTNGAGAIRCIYLTNGASLYGFTLTNGATLGEWPLPYEWDSGGGALGPCCQATYPVVTNCILVGNRAYWGGGAESVTLENCLLVGNSAAGGGGAADSVLNHCTLIGNSAESGGGSQYGTVQACTYSGNAAVTGGAAYGGVLVGCTFSNNAASDGGGACWAAMANCIIFGILP